LEGKVKEWYHGFFFPDGADVQGNCYWITLKTLIIERFGKSSWDQMIAVGQDRINRGHLHTWARSF